MAPESCTMSWTDVAIVQEVDLATSFAIDLKIHFGSSQNGYNYNIDDMDSKDLDDEDETVPSVVAASDESCASESVDSCSDESVTPLVSHPRRVNFTTVTVREYALTIGDHPSVAMYPLSLDWGFFESESQGIEQAESQRKSSTVRQELYGKGIKASRLTATERVARLVNVTGSTSQQLFQDERKRQLFLHETKRRAAIGLPPLVM